MALDAPRISFGIHSFTPYNRSTGEFFGTLLVIGDSEISFPASSVDLYGGSNKFAVANEITQIDGSFSMSAKAFDDFLFEKFAGAIVTTISASATGTASAITNKSGLTAVDAATGIASVGILALSEADLKFGHYIVKVVSPTTVDVYVDTNLQFNTQGTISEYQNGLLKITATPLTIPNGSDVTLPGFGIEFTGSAAVAMTIGDTAEFDVVAAHGGISDIAIGQSTIIFPEFGAFIYAQETSSGQLFRIQAHRLKGSSGMVLPLAEGGFMISNLVSKMLYDSAKDETFRIRAVAPAA